jgi:hypothetical protein
MRKTQLLAALAVVLVMTLVLVGCPKKQPSPTPGAGPAPKAGGPAGATPPEGAGTAKAPETAAPAGPTGLSSVTLTDQTVKNWIASTQDTKVKAILDKMKPAEAAGADAMASAKKAIESAAANAELDKAVKVHGFKDGKEWAAVTMKVMAGIMPAMQKLAEEQMPATKKGSPEYKKMKAQMDDEIAKSKQVFGELSADEQKVVEQGFAGLSKAMGESKAGKSE